MTTTMERPDTISQDGDLDAGWGKLLIPTDQVGVMSNEEMANQAAYNESATYNPMSADAKERFRQTPEAAAIRARMAEALPFPVGAEESATLSSSTRIGNLLRKGADLADQTPEMIESAKETSMNIIRSAGRGAMNLLRNAQDISRSIDRGSANLVNATGEVILGAGIMAAKKGVEVDRAVGNKIVDGAKGYANKLTDTYDGAEDYVKETISSGKEAFQQFRDNLKARSVAAKARRQARRQARAEAIGAAWSSTKETAGRYYNSGKERGSETIEKIQALRAAGRAGLDAAALHYSQAAYNREKAKLDAMA